MTRMCGAGKGLVMWSGHVPTQAAPAAGTCGMAHLGVSPGFNRHFDRYPQVI